MSDTAQKMTPPRQGKIAQIIHRAKEIHNATWSTDTLGDDSLRGKFSALYRVITLSIQGCLRNKIPMQAAALTYYCLMSLGPAIALALIISGFILKQEGSRGEAQFKAAIVRVIQEVIPQTTVNTADAVQNDTAENDTGAPENSLANISATLDQLIDRLIHQAANGKAGIVGIGILIVLAVLMISRVENTFNSIWSVKFGRPWKDRFINYFVFIFAAVFIGFALITMGSATAVAKHASANDTGAGTGAIANVPDWLLAFFQSSAPTLLSIALLTLLTTGLNKFMPNARVNWKPALAGGFLTALIIIGNQKLATLYVSKVISFQNLYGELSIMLILMFGMYLTWLFLLIGGQVSFAFQNARYLADYRAWDALSVRARRLLYFGCLVLVARRFKNGTDAPTLDELGGAIHAPRSIVTECLERLIKIKLIAPVRDNAKRNSPTRYLPAKPLELLKIGIINNAIETEIGVIYPGLNTACDPVIPRIESAFQELVNAPETQISLDELLGEK